MLLVLALLALGTVAAVAVATVEPTIVLGASRILPPALRTIPAKAVTDPEDFGAKTCTFGIASHCYWQPTAVKLLGLQTFTFGACMEQWRQDLAKLTPGGVAVVNKIFDALMVIVDALTLGLSKEARERVCFRWEWKLYAYEIDGVRYWAIRALDPQKHVLTGEVVKPPPLPLKGDAAWLHKDKPGDYLLGNQWTVPVLALFFADGAYRDVIAQADLRTLLREYQLTPEALHDYAREQSDEKWKAKLSTKAKAEAAYR